MCSVDPWLCLWLCNSNDLRRRRGRSSVCSFWLGIARGTLKGEGGAVENFKPFKKRRVIEIVENGFNGEFNVGNARVTNDLPRNNKNKTTLHITNFQSHFQLKTVYNRTKLELICGCCVRQNEHYMVCEI